MSRRLPPRSPDRKRLLWVAVGTFFLFALLIAQFFKIQIIQGEKWRQKALAQHQAVVTEPFRRGTFWSNVSIKQGHPPIPQPLALDVPKFHLHIDPVALSKGDRTQLAQNLWPLLGLPEGEWEGFRAQFDRRSRNRRLAMWLDRETRDAVMEWWLPYARKSKLARNALFFVGDYQRSHPFGKLLGQLLHTIRDYKEEETNQGVPTGGLESYFNEQLKGKLGKRLIVRSPRQELAMGGLIEEPESGADIYLTINHYLQAIAEEELEKGVKKAGGKRGWAIIMEPKTGEILAMAHYPFFSPSDYRSFFNSPEQIDLTRAKAISDPFEPGSVTKAVTLAIALLANEELKLRGEPPLFDPDGKMAVSSGSFPGRSKPLKDATQHSFINANMAIQRSSNIYPARLVHQMIDRLGVDWYRTQLQEVFGLGKKTGIELPAEAPGFLPSPKGHYPGGRLQWSASTPSAMAIGYNFLATSLQMARIYAIFANGGMEVQPTLIRDIRRGDRSILDQAPVARLPEARRLLPEAVANRVVEAMSYVTKGKSASRSGDIPGYTEAGKSGTAIKLVDGQYSDTDFHIASFIGFTPLSDPKLVIAVTVDETRLLGGFASGPIFREIAKRSLAYLGIAPDDPYGYPPGDPRRDEKRGYWIPETTRLQEIYDRWNNSPSAEK